MSDFEYIREKYNVPAYRNRVVTWQGVPYRIASTNGAGLVLRSEVLAHPTDPDLAYDGGASAQSIIDALETALRGLLAGVETYFSESNIDIDDFHTYGPGMAWFKGAIEEARALLGE